MNERKNFECLLPKTKKLLELLVDTAPFLSNYVFVGGSALALHICHRKSEDLKIGVRYLLLTEMQYIRWIKDINRYI